MNRLTFIVLLILSIATFCFAEGQEVVIDDFEGNICGGPEGTLDYGAGNGSSVEASAEKDVKQSGEQSLKITFNAVPGGYMWIARGAELDAKNAGWMLSPESIKWDEYKAISFYMYGSDSKATIALDIKDNGNEMWRYLIEDNFKGWKKIICNFDGFFARDDWQPDNADKDAILAFPIKSFQFEPRPEAKGTIYIDKIELIKK